MFIDSDFAVSVTDDDAATQAAPLIASPTMIVALLSPEVREASSTYQGRDYIQPEDRLTPLQLSKSTSPARWALRSSH
jgi:hypothetical protein